MLKVKDYMLYLYLYDLVMKYVNYVVHAICMRKTMW